MGLKNEQRCQQYSASVSIGQHWSLTNCQQQSALAQLAHPPDFGASFWTNILKCPIIIALINIIIIKQSPSSGGLNHGKRAIWLCGRWTARQEFWSGHLPIGFKPSHTSPGLVLNLPKSTHR